MAKQKEEQKRCTKAKIKQHIIKLGIFQYILIYIYTYIYNIYIYIYIQYILT